MKPGGALKRTTPLAAFSKRRWAEVTASGHRPVSTFTPRPREPFTAKAKVRKHTGPKKSARQLVTERSGGVCEFRGCAHAAEQMHHRRPRRMGGSRASDINQVANLLHVCAWHHEWIEKHRREALDLGLLLRADADPARVELWTRHDEEGPVFFNQAGGWHRFEEACA